MRLATLFALLPLAFALAQESVNLQRGIITAPGQTGAPAAPRPEVKPEDLCTLEGKVVSAATGEPVRKANLILRGTEMGPSSYPVSYTTTTDASGKFAMKDIEPGKYRLHANRGGFVRSSTARADPRARDHHHAHPRPAHDLGRLQAHASRSGCRTGSR